MALTYVSQFTPDELSATAHSMFTTLEGVPGAHDMTEARALDYLKIRCRQQSPDGFTKSEKIMLDGLASKLQLSFRIPPGQKPSLLGKVLGKKDDGLESEPLPSRDAPVPVSAVNLAPSTSDAAKEPASLIEEEPEPEGAPGMDSIPSPASATSSPVGEGEAPVTPGSSMMPASETPVLPVPTPAENPLPVSSSPPAPAVSSADDAMLAYLENDEVQRRNAMVKDPRVIDEVHRVARLMGTDRSVPKMANLTNFPEEVVTRILADTTTIPAITRAHIVYLARQIDPLTGQKYVADKVVQALAHELPLDVEAVQRIMDEIPAEAPPATVVSSPEPPAPLPVPPVAIPVAPPAPARPGEDEVEDRERATLRSQVRRLAEVARMEQERRTRVEQQLAETQRVAWATAEELKRLNDAMAQTPPSRAVRPTPQTVEVRVVAEPGRTPAPNLSETTRNAQRLEDAIQERYREVVLAPPSGDTVLAAFVGLTTLMFAVGIVALVLNRWGQYFPVVGSAGFLFLALIPAIGGLLWGIASPLGPVRQAA